MWYNIVIFYRLNASALQGYFNGVNMNQELMAIAALLKMVMPLLGSEEPLIVPIPANQVIQENASQAEVLVQKNLSMGNRHANGGVNQAFSDNILLLLHYFNQDVDSFK